MGRLNLPQPPLEPLELLRLQLSPHQPSGNILYLAPVNPICSIDLSFQWLRVLGNDKCSCSYLRGFWANHASSSKTCLWSDFYRDVWWPDSIYSSSSGLRIELRGSNCDSHCGAHRFWTTEPANIRWLRSCHGRTNLGVNTIQ